MRGLDAAGNPYRDKYQAWDRWAMEHAKDQRWIDWGNWNSGAMPGTYRMFFVQVDCSGYPIPILEERQKRIELAHAPRTQGQSECLVAFIAFGEMPPEMLAGLQAAEMAYKARYVPSIPRWLADDPPVWAIVLPGGEVVTMGELGSGCDIDTYGTWRNSGNIPPREYCRYSAQGKLLGKLPLGDKNWYELFWPEAQQVLGRFDRIQTMVVFDNGYVIVRRYAGQDVLGTYDYNGAPMPDATDPRLRDGNVWAGLVRTGDPGAVRRAAAATRGRGEAMNTIKPMISVKI